MRQGQSVGTSWTMRGFNWKRVFDVTASAAALTALSPLLLTVALIIRAKLGSPVLFFQERPGKNGVPFRLVKFRTMRPSPGKEASPGSDASRLTPTGRFLRAASLDELPELWNVLKGEMSLVGPRPLLMQYLDRYTPEQSRRHLVRPGLTGLAQVRGRNAITWEEKFEIDVWYVDNQSLGLDLKIIFMTIWQIFRPRGISAAGEATMPEFMGSSSESSPVVGEQQHMRSH